MISAIQTLKDGLKFCEDYLSNTNISEENIKIKKQQIKEHKLAIKILTDESTYCKICNDEGYIPNIGTTYVTKCTCINHNPKFNK